MPKISELVNQAPYDAEYIDIESLVDTPITILDVTPMHNAKGKGIHALIEINGEKRRICTHGVALTDILSRTEVLDVLKSGDPIPCKIVRKASEKNPERKVLKLEDA